MRVWRVCALVVLAAVLAVPSFSEPKPPPVEIFDGCGYLVEGVECILFQADDGALYLLQNKGTFGPGAYLHVRGQIRRDCYSYCQQEEGCIVKNTVELCDEGEKAVSKQFDGCGYLVQGVECVLFQADKGGLYVLSNRGGFQVGDYVHVVGRYDRFCMTYCMQGNGCIYNTVIEACDTEKVLTRTIDTCGFLVQGVECVLFMSDSGGLYLLSNRGGFQVGDYVHVVGTVDPFCITYCQQGNGCIFNNTIESCGGSGFGDCGYLVQGVECVLFQADSGGLYVLDNYGRYRVGHRVRVMGQYDPDCATYCMQGDGCILDNSITWCFDYPGGVILPF